ncbi:MAG: NifU family protein [Lachnospiraceae bacterium]|nr:NifU family protein [Lachnospiraceae bacterium]
MMKKDCIEIENILENYIRPQMKEHGGDIQLIDIKNRIAYVKLTGQCSSCPAAKYTMESFVKEELMKHTDILSDVKLHEEVSQELYDFAKQILNRNCKIPK